MKKIVMVFILCAICTSGCSSQKEHVEATKVLEQETSIVDNKIESTENNEETMVETTETNVEKREGTSFRNSIWGDSKDDVKKYEKDITLTDIDQYLLGRTTILGYTADVSFSFEEDKLYLGTYNFSQLGYTSGGQFINAYNNLKESLIKKYGTPYEDDIFNQERESLIEHAGPSDALKFGYVIYRAQWKTNTTNIALYMGAVNYEIALAIDYQDINYEPDINNSGL